MGALEGKVAIVTGAGQGLGACHARYLASQGAALVVNDMHDTAEEVSAEIVSAGGSAVAERGSVAEWQTGQRLVRRAWEEFGDLHILVNNAGFLRDSMSFSMEEEQWDAVVDVHMKGHFACSHFAAAYWREQAKAGVTTDRRIINTTSESGLFGGPGQSNYAAAKGGIVSMTLVMARELERYQVTVNAIAPRARTAMTELNPAFAKPEGGFDRYDPQNVSPVVGWLASDASADVSGQVFVIIGSKVWHVPAFELGGTADSGDKRWTIETLAAAKPALFGDRRTGVPPFGGPRA